jgi:thioredoxin 1
MNAMNDTDHEPTRAELDARPGKTVVEFGSRGCGICLAAQPTIQRVLGAERDLDHLKVEDGPGRPLGRSYGVRLWPTLVFLRDGTEVARVVRPTGTSELEKALQVLG